MTRMSQVQIPPPWAEGEHHGSSSTSPVFWVVEVRGIG